MPSGPKKRRSTKRKNQEKAKAKQTDELTTVSVVKLTIPIEELAKGAVWHVADSVDKELGNSKNRTGEVYEESKVAFVVEKSVEENQVSLLDVTSNEDILVSNDEPVLSQNAAGCTMVIVESGETLKVNGVVCNVSEETEQNFEQVHDHDRLPDVMRPDEMFERYHDLYSDNDPMIVDYDEKRGLIFRDANGELFAPMEEVTSFGNVFEDTMRMLFNVQFKDASVDENAIQENEESLFKATTNEDDKMFKDETVVSQNVGSTIESTSKCHELMFVHATDESIDTAPSPSMTVMSNEIIKDAENTSMTVMSNESIMDAENTSMTAMSNESTKEAENTSMTVMSNESMIVMSNESIMEAENSSMTVMSNESTKEAENTSMAVMSNESTKEAENTSMTVMSNVLSEEVKDPTLVVSSVANVSKETENTSIFRDHSDEAAGGLNDAAQLVSGKDTGFILEHNALSAENTSCSSAEIPFNSKEMQAVPAGLASPPTENLVYLACPMHCNSACSFPQLMKNVVELKSAIHSLKEDLEKTLDKLDAISY